MLTSTPASQDTTLLGFSESTNYCRSGIKESERRKGAFWKALVYLVLFSVLFGPIVGECHSPIELAATYLIKAQKKNGLFHYEYDFITDRYSWKDNIVRQTGVGYALAEYFQFSQKDNVKESILKALQAYSARSIPYGRGKLVSPTDAPEKAKAGATALALLTELLYYKASKDTRFQQDRRTWVRGLLKLRRSGKGFSKIPKSEEESPYSNGEIWLALATHKNVFPGKPEINGVLEKVDQYFIETYGKKPRVAFFHWGVMAANERYKTTGNSRFRQFISDQTEHYLTVLRPILKDHVNTCYAVEGLVTAAQVLRTTGLNKTLQQRLEVRIKEEVQKNLQFQIKEGQTRLQLTEKRYLYSEKRYLYSEKLPRFAGAFVNGLNRPQARIDFTQHCLSALIKYQSYISR